MSGQVEAKIEQLGHRLPAAPEAVGFYVPVLKTGNLVVTSGQLPFMGKELVFKGKVGSEIHEEDGINAAAEMYMIAMDLAAAHKVSPHNDIVDVLLSGTVEDEPLSEGDFCNFFLMLIVAGNETTRTVTSHGMRMLMEYPEQYQQLVDDPTKLEGAIEEFLRYNPAIIAFRRTAMEDVEIGGQKIASGDRVQLYYGAASGDETVFQDPDVFDITRAEREDVRNEHRAFGIGQHFCLGSHLARLELRVVFEEVLRHIRNPRLDGDISWLRSNFINGIKAKKAHVIGHFVIFLFGKNRPTIGKSVLKQIGKSYNGKVVPCT